MGVGEVYLDEISINFFKLMIIEACLWWIWTLCHSWKKKTLECFPFIDTFLIYSHVTTRQT